MKHRRPDFDTDSRSALAQLIGADGEEAEEGVAADFEEIDFVPIRVDDAEPEAQCVDFEYCATETESDAKFAAVLTALRGIGEVQLQMNIDGRSGFGRIRFDANRICNVRAGSKANWGWTRYAKL